MLSKCINISFQKLIFKETNFTVKIIFFFFNSEMLRVIDSLQLVDRIPEIATPANWVVST